MTDQTKFEEMLEKLVNEDRDGAEALFHEIVVEKSREIYQNILDEADEEVEETTDEEVDEAADEEVDESEDDDLDEMFGLDEPEMEADPAMDMIGDIEGGDEGDMDMDDEGDDDEEAEGPEEAMADLEDALEALKAEFEKMMGDEEPGDEEPEEEAVAFESDDEEVDEAADEEVDEATDEEEVEESKEPKTASEEMREYVEKITPKMGDTGTNGTKSAVAGKNDMGGTASNIAQGSADEKGGTGASAPKEDSAGNVNTPGGKASKSLKSQSPAKAGEAANKKPVMGG